MGERFLILVHVEIRDKCCPCRETGEPGSIHLRGRSLARLAIPEGHPNAGSNDFSHLLCPHAELAGMARLHGGFVLTRLKAPMWGRC